MAVDKKMSNIIIVSASNDRYLNLLEGMLSSLHPLLENRDLGIIDLGLTDYGKSKIEMYKPSVIFKAGVWKRKFPNLNQVPEYKKVYSSKPFLPEIFPGYDGYIWIDADIWVPDITAIDDYIIAGSETGAAFSFEIHPSYPTGRTIRKIKFFNVTLIKGTRDYWLDQSRSMFGSDVTTKHGTRHILNSGIFFISGISDVWRAWQESFLSGNITQKYQGGQLGEQTSLQFALIKYNIPYTTMATTYNWIPTRASPMVDASNFALLDPAYPHHPIKVIHLVGQKGKGFELIFRDGRRIRTNGEWSDFCQKRKDYLDNREYSETLGKP